jgi:hypothetical protein
MSSSAIPLFMFQPWHSDASRARTCRTCAHYRGEEIAQGRHVLCRRGGARQVHANPSAGCAFHLHEPGAD